MNEVFEKFDSIDAFVKTINGRKTNSVFAKQDVLASMETGAFREDFCKTKSYQEADEMLTKGYMEGYKLLKDVMLKNDNNFFETRRRTFNDVVGFAPHVPNLLAGVPQSMINMRRQKVNSKVVTIIFDTTVDFTVSSNAVIKASAALLSVVNKIERTGLRVNIFVLSVIQDHKSDKMCSFLIKIKDSGQSLNILKMAYPMIHPSFFRRHGFRFIETANIGRASKHLVKTYGRLPETSEVEMFLKKHNVVYNKLMTFYNMIDKTPEQIADMILSND